MLSFVQTENEENNNFFDYRGKSQPRHEVLVLGAPSSSQHLKSIQTQIEKCKDNMETWQRYINNTTTKQDKTGKDSVEVARSSVNMTKKIIPSLTTLHQ